MSDNTFDDEKQQNEAALPQGAAVLSPNNADAPTINLEDELKQSFIDYAMSVIVDRALPDVRDGLKPVHRRVLYDMHDLKVGSSGQTKKSARIVGDVIGRFHPHGDTAVYETIVRMSQWFAMREPLIYGQGNFGDIDGEKAAAMRYTEVKMTKVAELMLQDIDKETVDTYPNYDGNEQIPEVLPTMFPNLLVNGSTGIAVGMATKIPPHNINEVIDAAIAVLDNPEVTLPELMVHLPGPDFPTGGEIVGTEGIVEAYQTGRGRCVIRARTHTEVDKSGHRTIIVDEIPYEVHKVDIVKQISDLLRDKKIEGISDINDLSDKDNPVRIAIDLKRDAYEEAVLNNLFSQTMLQSTYGINMVALVNKQPRQLNLKQILDEFIAFRREVTTRRTVFDLRRDRRSAHRNEALLVARANIDRVVQIIKSSADRDESRARLLAEDWSAEEVLPLIERTAEGVNIALPQGIPEDCGVVGNIYRFSPQQIEAILNLPLGSLTNLDSNKFKKEYLELLGKIHEYLEILNKPERMTLEIKNDLEMVKAQYGSRKENQRRSGFTYDEATLDKADLVSRQDVIITLSANGYIKYQDLATYKSQHRGGKGSNSTKLTDNDYVKLAVVSHTHNLVMCFTSKGRAFVTYVYDLPHSETKDTKGRQASTVFNLEEDGSERITAILNFDTEAENSYIFLCTALGRVKKISTDAFKSFIRRNNSNGIKALTLGEGDELIGATQTNGDYDIVLFTSNGRAIRFCEYYAPRDDGEESGDEDNDLIELNEDNEDEAAPLDRHFGSGIRPSGRGSGTIRGIKLLDKSRLVSMLAFAENEADQCLIACANGHGKRMDLSELPLRNRGGQGVKVMGNLERNGDVIGATLASEQSEYMLVTDGGKLLRSPMDRVSKLGRYAAGCILMEPSEDESVIALQEIPADVVESVLQTQEARKLDKQDESEPERTAAEDSAASAPSSDNSAPDASSEPKA